MQLFLIRHGRAVSRARWSAEGGRDDELRPLDERGGLQAIALAIELADQLRSPTHLERVLSGPALRCQQSAEPLLGISGCALEIDERLDPDVSPRRCLELIAELAGAAAALVTHGEVIRRVLPLLELEDETSAERAATRKGSFWVLEGRGPLPERARYCEPSTRKTLQRRIASGAPKSLRCAVLDMGSTSFNLLVADLDATGTIRPVAREKVMLRLGEVSAVREEIPEAAADRALEVARELREVVKREKVQRFLPVATAAVRDAHNGDALARKLGRVLGESVRILSGEEEARLILRAFRARLPRAFASRGGGDEPPVLGLDLGGGSLELALGRGARVEREVTLPLGAVRLRSELVSCDPLTRDEVSAIEQRVRSELAPWREVFGAAGGTRAIAGGGTVRALARLAQAHRGGRPAPIPAATELDHLKLRELTQQLVPSTHEQRLEMPGMRRRRADLVPTGAIVLVGVVEALGLTGLTLCDWGLREGVLLESLG